MRLRLCFVILALLTYSCASGSTPQNNNTSKAQAIDEEKLKAALQTAFNEDGWLKIVKDWFGDVDSVGPVFIDGVNGRAVFKMKGKTGNFHEGEARLNQAQDTHWYLTFVNVPEIQQGQAKVNILIQ
jgi:hypothetical protein